MTTEARMWQDSEQVLAWLQRSGQQVQGPLTISRIGFGQSNITTLVADADGREWVMREPPPGDAAATAHDILREAGILCGLADSGVPVPRVVGTGTSPSGSPFMVMNRVDGAPLESEGDAAKLSAGQRRALGLSVAETLGRLHRLHTGVLDLRTSKTPYLTRQIRRVTSTWERFTDTRRHDTIWLEIRSALAEYAPQDQRPVIMHGDYRLSNLLVREGTIAAVLDWELCTVGDAMADLAWLLDDWRGPDEQRIVMPSPTRAGDFPDREEMVEIYQSVTGTAVHDLDVYRAFSQWRAASLLQGVLERRRAGAMGSHRAVDPAELDDTIAILLASATRHLRDAEAQSG